MTAPAVEWTALAPAVAVELLGQPNEKNPRPMALEGAGRPVPEPDRQVRRTIPVVGRQRVPGPGGDGGTGKEPGPGRRHSVAH